MSTEMSWFIEDYVVEIVTLESIFRGYVAHQLTENLTAMLSESTINKKHHIIMDISTLQATYNNLEWLYNALMPFIIDQQRVRWIVLYGCNPDLQAVLKDVMSDMVRNPCILVESRDEAIDFLYRKDDNLGKRFERAS